MYRYDASYVLEVEAKHADRFCLVKPVDTKDPGVAENIADWIFPSADRSIPRSSDVNSSTILLLSFS